MTYTAKTQQTVLLFFLILAITSIFATRNHPSTYYILIPYTLMILAFIFMVFQLTIKKDSLKFKILLFTITIYKKEVNVKQIERVKLKRVGWATKCAIVKNRRGFNFRIINFFPREVYNDLVIFAEAYDIPLSKTKDYLILERMK